MSTVKKVLDLLENVLNEVLRPKDKGVIDLFSQKKAGEGKIMLTDGNTLETVGFIGASKIAKWENGVIKILLPGLASRTQQSILKYMKKSIPPNFTKDISRFI